MNLEKVLNLFNGKKFLSIIDFKTNSILNGRAYSVKCLCEDVADGANVDMYLKSTDQLPRDALFNLSYNTGGGCRSYVYNNPIISNDGTEMPLINKNFAIGSNIVISDIFRYPTVTNVGTFISGAMLPGGAGIASIGDSTATYEAILPGNNGMKMLARATNVSGGVIDISIDLSIYM